MFIFAKPVLESIADALKPGAVGYELDTVAHRVSNVATIPGLPKTAARYKDEKSSKRLSSRAECSRFELRERVSSQPRRAQSLAISNSLGK